MELLSSSKVRCRLRIFLINIIAYADDIVLFSLFLIGLQPSFIIRISHYNFLKLSFNPKKVICNEWRLVNQVWIKINLKDFLVIPSWALSSFWAFNWTIIYVINLTQYEKETYFITALTKFWENFTMLP